MAQQQQLITSQSLSDTLTALLISTLTQVRERSLADFIAAPIEGDVPPDQQ